MVRALASHQCVPGSIPRSGVKCGLGLLVLFSAPRAGFLYGSRFFLRGFSPEVSVSMLHSKALPFQVVLNCWAFDVPVKMLLDPNEGFPSERIPLFFAFNSCLATCMIISCKRLCLFIVLKYNHCISFEFNNCVEFRGVIFCLSCLLSLVL